MAPQVVVFDLGKVLLDFDYGIAAQKIATHGRVSPRGVQELIDHSALLFRLETGEITNQQFFQEVAAGTGFAGDYHEFSAAFADIFKPIVPMVELHARCRACKVPTFIFSNTNGIAIGHIRRNFPFFAHFDGYVFSYEHGAMKPTAKIYEVVEKMAGAQGEKILFLDDRKENVSAGAARGWQVIHHCSVEETTRAFERMNL